MLSFMQVAAALKAAGSEQDLTEGQEQPSSTKVQGSIGKENQGEENTTNQSTELKKEDASNGIETSVDAEKTEDYDKIETEEIKQSVADDIPDGTELTDEDRQDGSVSVAESDRESLLDKVDLFDADTKDEEELREVQRDIFADQTTEISNDSLDYNGNEATEGKEDIQINEAVSSGDTVENFVEESSGINGQFSGLESQNGGSSVDDSKEVDEFFVTYTVVKDFKEEEKEDSASNIDDQEATEIKRQVTDSEEKQVIIADSQSVDTRSFTFDSLEKESNIVEEGTYTVRSEISESFTNVTASLEDTEMPEKQDPETLSSSPRGDGVLSPSLQRANFRYRWAKTVRTESNYVVFFSTYKMEEPIKLTWSDACECYYSQEYDIPTGVYRGNLVIDGQTYPVEDLTIKHYTFEADLYVKDDLADDEANLKQTTDASISVEVDTQGSSVDPPERYSANLRDSIDIGDVDGGIHKSSKYEELVKKQLSQSNALESDMNRSNLDKSSYEIGGRRSPIGDVATEPYQDGGDFKLHRESLGDRPLSRGSLGDRPFKGGDLNISVVEDEVERPSSVHSNRFSGQGSGRQTPGSMDRLTPQISNDVDEFFASERREPVRSSHSSARQTPQQADFVLSPGRLSSDPLRDNDYMSPGRSQSGSLRQTPTDLKDTVDDILGNDVTKSPARSGDGSVHSSARQTPSANVVGDILGKSSPALVGRTEGSTPVTPRQESVHSTTLMSPPITSDLVRGSQEKVYGSRPQSLTSEQELTQYFENGNRHGSTHGSLPASAQGSERSETRRTLSVHASPTVQNSDRPLSSSSLPVITTQQRLMAEKRSMTPDNHIRVPGEVPAARMLTPRSNVSSRASDRTITPGIQENGFKEDVQSQRILDLEDSVRNLRKLLSSREAEVHELNKELKHLKELNKSLTEELDKAKERPPSRAGLAELERKYSHVLNEKEILATEVVKLRDEVEELQRGRPGEPEGDLGDTSSCGISSYNPNNPYALQRRISDLQSQVQDLQEANEAAVSELSGAERRIGELTRENEALREGQHGNVSELKAENRQLHDQISRLYEQGYGGGITSSREDDNRLKIECQQLKDDNKALKERNYKLHEENLKLKEDIVNVRTGVERSPVTSYTDIRLSTQPSSMYSENRLHQTEPLLDKRISQPRRTSQDYAGERLSATDRYQLEKSYTSPLKNSYGKEVEVRASSTLKKPVDQYYLTEKTADHQFRSSLDRYKSMRSTEPDLKLKHSSDIEDVRLKHTLTRDDSGFKLRSMDNAESRIRSALEKADANLRNVDKDNSRYNYDSNFRDDVKDEPKYKYDDKLSSYSKTWDSPGLERNYDRKGNDNERSRSELYRSMPDGGTSDKESQSSRERYDRSKSSERRIFGALDMDSERLRYDKERRAPSTEREYTSSDPVFDWSRSKGIKEKSKEWSRSEADLRYARGRSRTPDRYFFERKRSVSPPEHKSSTNDVYTARRRRDYPTLPHSARSPATRYRWDDEVPARQTTNSLQDRLQSDLPAYSKTAPSLSVYRPKGEYGDFGKGYDLYKRPSPATFQDDTGDVSDTATDILVNAEPYEKQPVSPVPDNRLHRRHGSQRSTSQLSRSRRRHDSLDSSGSMSDVEDIDDQLYGKHSRSKSADGRELIRRSQPLGTDRSGLSTGGQGERTVYKTLPTPSTANLRTVTPSVLTTQHNRNMLASSTGSLTSLTTGMRPFAPRSPADISIEDVVKFSRQGGKLSQGRVKFVGHLPGRSDAYLGVELDKEDGKHDGKFEGMRYFRCKPNKGVFVAFNKVVMAWAP